MIKITRDVNKAMVDDITTPILGLMIDKVELVFVEADPTKLSVINFNTFFLFTGLCFFFYYSLSFLRDLIIFS